MMICSHELSARLAQAATIVDENSLLPNAGDVLTFLQQGLEPAAGRWLTSVIPFAHCVPAVSGNILEVHFDRIWEGVDYAARLNASFDKKIMAGLRNGEHLFPFLPGGFLSLLDQMESGFEHGILNTWLEYDAPFNDAPALFFDINSGKPFHPQAIYRSLTRVAGALNLRLNEQLFRFLERISEAGLQVVYYGLMFSRKTASVRLTINGIKADNLTDALRGLGWNGNYNGMEKIKSMYLSNGQKLVVGVDVGSHLEARIGLEVFDDNHRDFVQRLRNNGHINQTHYELLHAWEQKFVLPDRLGINLMELHQRPVNELHTRLNHFKFVLDDTERVTTKGYLYYCF